MGDGFLVQVTEWWCKAVLLSASPLKVHALLLMECWQATLMGVIMVLTPGGIMVLSQGEGRGRGSCVAWLILC